MKKLLMILGMTVAITVSSYAGCITTSLSLDRGSNYNYIRLKNACNADYKVTIQYYERESGKWITKDVNVYSHNVAEICIYSSTQYRVVSTVEN